MTDNHTSHAIGVILAAGSGLRFGSDRPKQFHTLAGRMVVEYAIATFMSHSLIDEVIVVHAIGTEDKMNIIRKRFAGRKPLTFVKGGSTRQASTREVLRAVTAPARSTKILFHDAVRPFLSPDIIRKCIFALDSFDAVDTVLPTADTIVVLDEEGECLQSIPPRTRLRRGQTPQGFWLHQITEAYSNLTDTELARFTDDCGVLLSRFPDIKIATVDGQENNIKITTQLDMFMAEQLMYSGSTNYSLAADRTIGRTVAVIFGGTSGLGQAATQRMQELGWTVEVASRSTGIDIRDLRKVQEFLRDVHARHRVIDLIANFAGVLRVGSLHEMDLSTVDEILSINLMGSIIVSQASLPYLAESRGHLVLTSSSSYYRGRANTAVYSASKAAVVNLTQALAEEWIDRGVAVSCVVPRRADTPMRRRAFPEEDSIGNLKPETVANIIVELYQKNQTGIIKHVY
jgi:2-C-methyl-D-erythritol 4-phosphate cytidylyltransferase